MNNSKLIVLIAATLSALAETGEIPEGVLYAQMMPYCTLEEFQHMVEVTTGVGYLVKNPSRILRITPKGCELAKSLEDKVAEAKRAKMQVVSG